MKQFDVPEFYRSPLISELKAKRRLDDPRKKDFSPSKLTFGDRNFYFARHFGFCYGVENAIEIAYKALRENPDKRIFLLSEMIHNPAVNEDLFANGITFLQDTHGNQLIPFSDLSANDVVLIPAFGTTVEIQETLEKIGINTKTYNTTCPFVEKVWNRSEKLGSDQHTIIVHGKASHEETRATVSRSSQNAPVLIVFDMNDAIFLGEVIKGSKSKEAFFEKFEGCYTANFDVEKDLLKIGVVNQTTMLATETQAIADYLRQIMIEKYGEAQVKAHIADTRDTLCYATNDNQSATLGLMEVDADVAIVVGGYKSSNTTHLVEILEKKFTTFFIESVDKIISDHEIESYNIHSQKVELINFDFHNLKNVIVTSGASCPDSMVEAVLNRLK
jgi:4-hydroxy-3-methylbut-2-en-1-yl diphosphate reductase